jgi:hypothetical protein
VFQKYGYILAHSGVVKQIIYDISNDLLKLNIHIAHLSCIKKRKLPIEKHDIYDSTKEWKLK